MGWGGHVGEYVGATCGVRERGKRSALEYIAKHNQLLSAVRYFVHCSLAVTAVPPPVWPLSKEMKS